MDSIVKPLISMLEAAGSESGQRAFRSVSVVLSALGSLILAFLAVRSPDALVSQIRPTWDDLGDSPERIERVAARQKWSTVGLITLGIGLGFRALQFYTGTDLSGLELLFTILATGFVLSLSYWHGWLAEKRVTERLQGSAED